MQMLVNGNNSSSEFAKVRKQSLTNNMSGVVNESMDNVNLSDTEVGGQSVNSTQPHQIRGKQFSK